MLQTANGIFQVDLTMFLVPANVSFVLDPEKKNCLWSPKNRNFAFGDNYLVLLHAIFCTLIYDKLAFIMWTTLLLVPKI